MLFLYFAFLILSLNLFKWLILFSCWGLSLVLSSSSVKENIKVTKSIFCLQSWNSTCTFLKLCGMSHSFNLMQVKKKKKIKNMIKCCDHTLLSMLTEPSEFSLLKTFILQRKWKLRVWEKNWTLRAGIWGETLVLGCRSCWCTRSTNLYNFYRVLLLLESISLSLFPVFMKWRSCAFLSSARGSQPLGRIRKGCF